MARHKTEFVRMLATQLRILQQQGDAFDAGDREAARQLSNAVSILVDNRRNHFSLVAQMGIEKYLPIIDTSKPIRPGNYLGESALLADTAVGEYARPLLFNGLSSGLVDIGTWLDQVVLSIGKYTLTRRQVLRYVRDKDGGAHFDKDRGENIYRQIVEVPFMTFVADGMPVHTVELPIVRQMALEVQASLLLPVSARVNATSNFVSNESHLAIKDRGWVVPAGLIFKITGNGAEINMPICNFGGETADVHLTIHAASAARGHEQPRRALVSSTRARLASLERELLGARMADSPIWPFNRLVRGADSLWINVSVQYISGRARPTEAYLFRFDSDAYGGLALLIPRLPTVDTPQPRIFYE